jgi:hypothetical protein
MSIMVSKDYWRSVTPVLRPDVPAVRRQQDALRAVQLYGAGQHVALREQQRDAMLDDVLGAPARLVDLPYLMDPTPWYSTASIPKSPSMRCRTRRTVLARGAL